MLRLSAFIAATALLAASSVVTAEPAQQGRHNRQDIARAQGVPPGQLPPSGLCRVWYDDRPNGRQPSATTCARAEAIATRDRNARVIYGEDTYWDNAGDDRYGSRYPDNEGAVRRGSVRDPRQSGGTVDRYGREGGSVAFRNGYRDGLTKGREDAEDGDRFDVNRHSWYRSATRGYESELGTRYTYIDRYRRGFESGYSEGFRVYTRR